MRGQQPADRRRERPLTLGVTERSLSRFGRPTPQDRFATIPIAHDLTCYFIAAYGVEAAERSEAR
jgi:hypothetical protein